MISPKIASRPGGYTRVIKLGRRVGDNAELAMIELVDYNEIYGNGIDATETAGAKKTRRAGRSKKPAVPKEEVSADTEKSAPVAKEKTEKTVAENKEDDLTRIEGIGPKAAEALHEAGITDFAKLAAGKAEDIKEILEKSEGNFNAQDPHSWPEQAQLAADGKWDELKELQDKLIGGR